VLSGLGAAPLRNQARASGGGEASGGASKSRACAGAPTAVDSHDAADLAQALRPDGPAVTGMLGHPRPAIDAIIDARLATCASPTGSIPVWASGSS
jgi:hypothetical protein